MAAFKSDKKRWLRNAAAISVLAILMWAFLTETLSFESLNLPQLGPTSLEMASTDAGQNTLVYRQINDLKLDLDFYPASDESSDEPFHPLVILIHDGCFTGGSKDAALMKKMAERLRAEGFSVAVPNYRKAPEYPYPAAVEDMQEVLRFLRRNAQELSISANEVASFGLSAGGYLALRMASEEHNQVAADRIQAAVSFFGRTDFVIPNDPKPNNEIDDCAERFMGFARGPETLPAFQEASIHVNERFPPVFLYHGKKDDAVPAFHSLNLKMALDKVARPSEIFVDPNLQHMQFPPEAFDRAIDFLKRELHAPGAGTEN